MNTTYNQGQVSQILEENGDYQKLEIKFDNQSVVIENGAVPSANTPHFQVGDKVLITEQQDPTGQSQYFIADYVRTDSLVWLVIIFVVITLIVARKKGLMSLLGLVLSFGILFLFTLPQISAGQDPLLISLASAIIIIPANFYLAHGYNQKTNLAVIGTFISLVLTGLLALFFVNVSKLSGFSSDEASFLEVAKQGAINMRGLLLAGVVVGILGILDDVTVSQTSIVSELKKAAPHLRLNDLYMRAMEVGKDHIASVVNTLILVYAGASLPLLLLFIDNPQPLNLIINNEIIAEEIVKTLVASIGLILAVPITTFISAYYFGKKFNH